MQRPHREIELPDGNAPRYNAINCAIARLNASEVHIANQFSDFGIVIQSNMEEY